MEQKFNTSFIPKKSLQADVDDTASGKYSRRHDSRGPGFFLTLLILIVAVVVSGGLFGYTTIIESTVQKKINTLKEQKNLFTESNIELLIAEQQRIELVKELVASHVAVSELFTELERITLKSIQYTGMEYSDGPELDPAFVLAGIARDYQDVAMQTTQYRESVPISSPVVQELGTEDTGLVYFAIGNRADPRLVSFASAVEARNNRTEATLEQPSPVGTTTIPTEVIEGTTGSMAVPDAPSTNNQTQ